MSENIHHKKMLDVAIEEAKLGLSEGGIPIGAALFDGDGNLLGRGHNRRVQENDPSVHGETDAFRKAGRQTSYRDKIMVTTLAPCWYCSGLIRQFKIGTVIVGESVNFDGGIAWLRENGVKVIDMGSKECVEMLKNYTDANRAVWNEDIGEVQEHPDSESVKKNDKNGYMKAKFDDVLEGFEFSSFGGSGENFAYLERETGKLFYYSEYGDNVEDTPDDLESDKYIVLPTKIDLDLGKDLVFYFATQNLPEDLQKVESIFHRSGAYSNFKGLLERRNLLEEWYEFETKATESALRKWCEGNSIDLIDESDDQTF